MEELNDEINQLQAKPVMNEEEDCRAEVQSTSANHDLMFKVILIGDQAVGKSSILSRITGKEFRDNYDATVGVEFGNFVVEIGGKMIKMQIWDTAGMESFRSITRIFYRGAHLVCVVYDVTKEDTFENIEEWENEVENNADKDALLYLIGNMKDKEDQRKIEFSTGYQKANEFGYNHFCETSAKTKEGIEDVFIRAAKEIYIRNKDRLAEFVQNNDETESVAQNSMMILSDGRKSSIHLSKASVKNLKNKKQKKCC